MIVTGLGIGSLMSLFTIVVQNAFSFSLMGVVTANLQFFRSIGSTVGIAIFGSLLTSRFSHELSKKIPASVVKVLPHHALRAISNPSVLLSPQANRQLQKSFQHFGPRGIVLVHELLFGVRSALTSGTHVVFLFGAMLMVAAFLLSLSLKEIPLRKGNTEVGAADSVDSRTARGVLGIALGMAVQQNRIRDPKRRILAIRLAERLLEQYLHADPSRLSAGAHDPTKELLQPE
jgi:hypothetical protein